MVRLLNDQTIRQLVNFKDAISIVDQTFKGLGAGTVINPSKVNLDLGQTGDYPYYDGFINAMPAYVDFADTAGLKWVVGMGGKRRELGLPYINSMMFLVDPKIGEFKAILDGTYISNLRTGAQTAVALNYLLPDKKAISLGIFGAGTQGRMQLEALSKVFDIKKLDVYDYYEEAAQQYAEDMAEYVEGPIQVVTKPDEASNNDVLITATSASEPFLTEDMVSDGTIVCPLGSFSEITDELILKADHLFVDHPDQALHRGALEHLAASGEIDQSDVDATFGELANDLKVVPNLEDKITLCIPIGIGALDVAIGGFVYQKASEKNLGDTYQFSAYDVKDYLD